MICARAALEHWKKHVLNARAKVYPELKRNDEVHLIGLVQEGLPFMPIMMHNSEIGISSIFIDEQIKIKKGIFSSFIIKNPIMVVAEEMMNNLLSHA